jgi:hypothetical protein
MSTNVVTPEFRVAFPSVFKPRRNDLNGKDEFSLVALFPKGADLTPLKKAAHAACVKKWGEDQKKWPQGLRSPLRDQGDRFKINDEGQEVAPQGYEKGAVYLNLRSNQRPGVVDQNVQPIIDESEFYGGCWAKASINAYAYDQKGNRGVAFGLGNVQKVKDDDAFGNRTKPEQDFAPVATNDSETATDSGSLFT